MLCLVLAAAISPEAVGADRAFLLRRETSSAGRPELSGWLALGSRRADDEPLSDHTLAEWNERAHRGDFDSVSPELTGLVRALRFPLEDGVDASAACALSGGPRRTPAGDPELSALWSQRMDVRGFSAVPIRVAGEVEAVLVAECFVGDGTLAPQAEQALAFLAQQAGRALEAQRWAILARMRKAQLANVRDVARGLLEPTSLTAGLERLARVAAQAVGASHAAFWVKEPRGRALRLECVHGPEDTPENTAVAGELLPLAEACAYRRESPLLDRASFDPRMGSAGRQAGPVAGSPLVILDRSRGALLVFGRAANPSQDAASFTREEHEVVSLYAGLAALLVERAELAIRVQEAEQRVEDLRSQALRTEGLAQLGDVSVRLAREMTNPLASINGFARRVHRALEEGEPNREYLEIVIREGERLERMVAEHLQFASLSKFRLGLASVNHIVQESLQRLSSDVARKRVRLLKKFSPEIPAMLLDADKMGQAVGNVLANAIEGVPQGGCVKVETRVERGHVVVETAHDGPAVAGELLDQLFVPFATGGRAGPGLGLAVAQRIVRDHGGEIGVRREGDWGQVMSLHLPVIGNEDRRHGRDRRRWSGDRRNRLVG